MPHSVATPTTRPAPSENAARAVRPLAREELVAAEGMRADADLFGIALSGGGIRSATFNLGLLQGLQKTGLLKELDYVSTVSGGGYIGGFWTAWRHHERQRETDFPARPAGGVEHPAVRHLRRFSNYLSPRLGLLSYDTGRLAVAGLTAVIPTLLATIALLALAVLGWALVAGALFGDPRTAGRLFAGMTFLVFIAFEAVWKDREGRAMDRTYHWLATIAVVITWLGTELVVRAGAAAAAGSASRLPPQTAASAGELLAFLFPALLWGALFFVLAIARFLLSRYTRTFARLRVRAALDRVLSRLLFLIAAWTIITGLWLGAGALYDRIATQGLSAFVYSVITATLAGVFAWTRKLGASEPNKPFGSALAAALKPRVPQLVAYAVVVLVMLAVMMAVMGAANGVPWLAGVLRVTGIANEIVLLVALSAMITVATLLFFHPNRVGLHAFYRSRLARAYLGASNPANEGRRPFTEEAEGDDISLHRLAGNEAPAAPVRPLHLVCCAVNDLLPPEPLTNMQRGAASAVLSPLGLSVAETYVDAERAAGVFYSPWHGESPTLGAAITASGAAFNSMMGTYSKRFGPAATFVLAMLNLRLGMWQQHPRHFERPAAAGGLAGLATSLSEHLPAKRATKEWWLPGLRFYKELFGMSSAQGRDVHLSDGGHFENTGAYELIRRECRYIIAADCGADPDRAFDDVANLIRRVRQDFGVEIRIDLAPLRLNDAHLAAQPMVAGDIFYPSGDTGVLLLFKPTLVGTEPPDVTQYRTRNAAFPNEPTGDQFYDEAQWEAYRQLGEHAADSAFAFLRQPTTRIAARAGRDFVARAFALARFEWLPEPADFEARLARFSDRAAELDSELRRGLNVRDAGGEAATVEVAGDGMTVRVRTAGTPDGETLQRSLDTVRRTVLLMEETYYAWDLESTHGQPRSLGVMNCMGRWCHGPPLRMWWPLMKPLHSPPFTRFLETRFNLVGIQPSEPDGSREDVVTETVEPDTSGLAAYCWQLTSPPAREGGPGYAQTYITLRLHMFYEGTRVYDVQAALVRAFRAVDGDVIWWDADDFFVPPGLWGIGVGEDFLKRLGERQRGDRGGEWVALRTPPIGDAAAGRSTADRRRMYEAAGFRHCMSSPPGIARGDGVEWLERRPLR
jgi:hypothetical protein